MECSSSDDELLDVGRHDDDEPLPRQRRRDADRSGLDLGLSNGSPGTQNLRGRPVTPNGSPQYEEFFGGTMPCPTCRGSGRIPRDKENELVALIPMSDKRLAPRRTTLYVVLAILVSIIIGGLIAFFLFPRGVHLLHSSAIMRPKRIYVNTTQEILFMELVNEYNISNTNFYSIYVQNLTMSVMFDDRILSTGINNTVLRIPLRSTLLYQVPINVTFSQDEGYIAHYCGYDVHRPHMLLMPFQATLKTSYFGGILENTLTTYQHVQCTAHEL